MNRMILSIGLMAAAMPSASSAGDDGNTTIVRNGNSVSIITQSGDPAQAVVRIEQEPGRTVIYRQSGGNTSIVTQSNDPKDFPIESLPPHLRDLFKR